MMLRKNLRLPVELLSHRNQHTKLIPFQGTGADPSGNAKYFSEKFSRPLRYEDFQRYDTNAASLQDCYVPANYRMDAFWLDHEKLSAMPLLTIIGFILSHKCKEDLTDSLPLLSKRDIFFLKDLAKFHMVMLSGPPGVGKSTFLYRLAFQMAHTEFCSELHFFGAALRNLAQIEPVPPETLFETVLQYLNCDVSSLENSVLCLDGLDELLSLWDAEDHAETYFSALSADISKIENCTCILTARKNYMPTSKSAGVLHIELEPFSHQMQLTFAKKYTKIHPNAEEQLHLLRHTKESVLENPLDLYTFLALNINSADSMFYEEQLFLTDNNHLKSQRDTAQLRSFAEAVALRMTEKEADLLNHSEVQTILSRHRIKFDRKHRSQLRKQYDLIVYCIGGHWSVKSTSSRYRQYFVVRKLEKYTTFCILSDNVSETLLRKWYRLFTRFLFSEDLLTLYSLRLSQSQRKIDSNIQKAAEDFVNASLAGNNLFERLESDVERLTYYLLNIARVLPLYLPNSDLETQDFTRWMSVACSFGAEFQQIPLASLTFRNDIDHVSITSSTVRECTFQSHALRFGNFTHNRFICRFSDVLAEYCDFSNTNFSNCIFENCRFNDCNLSDTVFSQCTFKNVVFFGCNLTYARMNKAQLQHCTFENTILKFASLKSPDHCTFKSVDITSANFSGDLRNSTLDALHMDGVYGADHWHYTARPAQCLQGCSILLSQIKNIYQFLSDISDVTVYDDDHPDQITDPLLAQCEYLFCKNLPIAKEDLELIAEKYWPKGIVVNTNLFPFG